MSQKFDPVTEFNLAFLSAFRTMVLTALATFAAMQDQMLKFMGTMTQRGNDAQQAGWKALESWFESFRTAQTRFHQVVEENFKHTENVLNGAEKK